MATSERFTLTIDVSGSAPVGCRTVEAELHVPAPGRDRPVLWCCVAGGGVNRSYFALDVASGAGEYNMARYLADRGALVLLIDPPGVGGSDTPRDGYELTPSRLSDVLADVVTQVQDGLRTGRWEGVPCVEPRRTVGLGHSAGALLIVSQQAGHRSYDALALLGFSDTGLVEVLNAEELAFVDRPDEVLAALAGLVAERFGGPLPPATYTDLDDPTSSRPSDPLQSAVSQMGAPLLAMVGMMAIIPGTMRRELDQIDVPTFGAMGDRDISGTLDGLARQLPACRDLTLVTLAATGHNHNQAESRFELWGRLERWIDSVAPAA